jgi:hypothetical protein
MVLEGFVLMWMTRSGRRGRAVACAAGLTGALLDVLLDEGE